MFYQLFKKMFFSDDSPYENYTDEPNMFDLIDEQFPVIIDSNYYLTTTYCSCNAIPSHNNDYFKNYSIKEQSEEQNEPEKEETSVDQFGMIIFRYFDNHTLMIAFDKYKNGLLNKNKLDSFIESYINTYECTDDIFMELIDCLINNNKKTRIINIFQNLFDNNPKLSSVAIQFLIYAFFNICHKMPNDMQIHFDNSMEYFFFLQMNYHIQQNNKIIYINTLDQNYLNDYFEHINNRDLAISLEF